MRNVCLYLHNSEIQLGTWTVGCASHINVESHKIPSAAALVIFKLTDTSRVARPSERKRRADSEEDDIGGHREDDERR